MAVELPEIYSHAAMPVRHQAVGIICGPAAEGQAFGLHPPEDPVILLIREVKSIMVVLQLFRNKVEDATGVLVVGEVDGQMLVDGNLGKAPLGWLYLEAEELAEAALSFAGTIRWFSLIAMLYLQLLCGGRSQRPYSVPCPGA